MYELVHRGGTSKVLSLVPQPLGQKVQHTYLLVVIHHNASGANGEGGRATHMLTQEQASLGFWPPNAHL